MHPPSPPQVNVRSPFLVIPEFVSPMTCEEIIGEINFTVPQFDAVTNKPTKTVYSNPICDKFIEGVWASHATNVSRYFNTTIEGIETIAYEWYPTNYVTEGARSDTYIRSGDKWIKSSVADFIGVLFLMNLHDGSTSIDPDYEVMGGKLEFPTFKFGFNPTAGTLILFPAAPNFINGTTPIVMGDLYQARISLTTEQVYQYDPRQFPGTFQDWFKR